MADTGYAVFNGGSPPYKGQMRDISFRLPGLMASLVFTVASLLSLSPAFAADVDKGRATYRASCASCHAIESDATIFGPHLKGVFGRKAGSLPDYNYSPAMRVAGDGGMVWDDKALSAFLASPGKAVAGTKMRFFGFWFQSQIDDVIAYLKANP